MEEIVKTMLLITSLLVIPAVMGAKIKRPKIFFSRKLEEAIDNWWNPLVMMLSDGDVDTPFSTLFGMRILFALIGVVSLIIGMCNDWNTERYQFLLASTIGALVLLEFAGRKKLLYDLIALNQEALKEIEQAKERAKSE